MSLTADDLTNLISLCEIEALEREGRAREQAREGYSMSSVRCLLAGADYMRELKGKLIAMSEPRTTPE